jgi:hypothetical protein
MLRSWAWAIGFLHLVQGIILFGWDTAAYTTAMNSMVRFTSYLGDGHYLAGSILIFAAILAAYAGFSAAKRPLITVSLLLPQQLILLIVMFGAIEAIAIQSFADGVVRPWAFIATDQMPSIIIGGCHTGILVAYISRYIRHYVYD